MGSAHFVFETHFLGNGCKNPPFLFNIRDYRYIDQEKFPEVTVDVFSCRELLLDELNLRGEELVEKTEAVEDFVGFSELSFGIRCFGELYNKLYNLSRGRNLKGALEEFILKEFRIPVEVEFKRIRANISKFIPGAKSVLDINGFHRRVDGSVAIKFGEDADNKYLPIICLLALLREIRITEKILSNKIDSMETLIEELLRIAHDRFYGKDFSYDCFEIYKDKKGIEEGLKYAFNMDGSDYASIIYMAIFLYSYKKMNYNISSIIPGDFDEFSGPVSFVSFIPNKYIESFIKEYDSKSLKLMFKSILSYIFEDLYEKDMRSILIDFYKFSEEELEEELEEDTTW